jgi:hypothetical protein
MCGLGRALGGPTQRDVAAGEALDRDRVVVDTGVRRERVGDGLLKGVVAHGS